MEELEYKREMNRNYMVIQPKNEWNDTYTVRMLSGNKIPGLLEFQEKQINGTVRYYYDITSKQPLGRTLEHRSLTEQEVRALISSLLCALKQMERFLLDTDQICIQPEYIYLEPDTFRTWFCLIPGRKQDFSAEFLGFAQYILDHVDHSDGEAVVLAFSIFRVSRRDNFGIIDIEECLGRKVENKNENLREEMGATCREENEASVDMGPSELWNCVKPEGVTEVRKEKSRTIGYAALLVMAVCIPGGVAGIFGLSILIRWKWAFFIMELVLLIVGLGLLRGDRNRSLSKNVSGKWNVETEEDRWEEYFIEENSDWIEQIDKKEPMRPEDENEDDMQTILLTSVRERIDQKKRMLVSVNGENKIDIGYFPFLIGKNKAMADFCLNEPGVSRLHVKIEELSGEYFVTDLNSTNGTKVNGELLKANETKKLLPGDELVLADIKFLFQ